MLETMPQAKQATHPGQILAVLVLAAIAYSLSQTLVIPALPDLARDTGASPTAASWVLTAYLLSASVATPIVGKLGDLFGKGRVLTGVMLGFAAGSVICALASSIELVIAGRTLQGMAGGVFPLSFGVIRDTFPRHKVIGGIGLLSASFGIGGAIGLPLAGIIVDHLDVSWLFWIGLISLPVAFAVHRLVPPSPPVQRTRVDWLGAVVLSLALVAILLAVTEGEDWGWDSARTLGLFAAGLALLVAWLRIEATVDDPLIELGVLRERVVAATNAAGFLFGFAMFSSFLLIPEFAQTPESAGYGFGMSVTAAGFLMAPAAAAQLLAGPLAGLVAARFGLRAMLALGSLCAALAFVIMALAHGHPWEFIVGGTLFGAGLTFALSAMANLIVESVPQHEVGIATGINTIMRTVGGAFGAAGATAILAAHRSASGVLTESGYSVAFLASAAGGVLAIGAALLIPRRLQDEVHDRDEPAAGGDPALQGERLHA
jgi:EmrB/QacA subfamily drug resistance transporter